MHFEFTQPPKPLDATSEDARDAGQTLPHEPQLSGSLVVSRQYAPRGALASGHIVPEHPHIPAEQTGKLSELEDRVWQLLLHEPHLEGSCSKSTQAPLHDV
jgi:hypothetical protein